MCLYHVCVKNEEDYKKVFFLSCSLFMCGVKKVFKHYSVIFTKFKNMFQEAIESSLQKTIWRIKVIFGDKVLGLKTHFKFLGWF